MNADEVVRALRWLARDTDFVFAEEQLNAAADLIESQQAQLTESQRRADAAAGAISHYMTDILGISRYGRNSPIRPGEQIGYTAPIGTERKNADGYMLVKVSDTGIKNADWKTKQAVMWEKYHNKPPDGVVVFLNGDRTDFLENNLYCVSRKAHGIMCLNKWYTEDSERTLAAIKLCELLVAIKATNKNEEMEDEEC
jgi:hypothetical protein